jgi:hypothetical protein
METVGEDGAISAFLGPGHFWRGNLHTHSAESDGALTVPETISSYRDFGYDFVSITDHFRPEYGFPITDTSQYRTSSFTTLLGAELHAPGVLFGSEWHILAVGLPIGFRPPEPGESGPDLAWRARRAGAFIGMAHPSASMLTEADAESLDAAHAVEVYNALSAYEDRGDSWALTDVLLTKGRRLGTYAADDAHFQPQDPPGRQAWVQVRSEELTPESLLVALKAGRYYSSTGPVLEHVELLNRGETIEVRCSPAQKVLVTGSRPGKQLCAGVDLTEVQLPVAEYQGGYFRVTVEDPQGGRAWTNPIYVPATTAPAEGH